MNDLLWAPARPESKFAAYHEPQKKTQFAAAYDLYLPYRVMLEPGKTTKVDLNLLCLMPEDERAVLMMRSGWADKYGFVVVGGLIDSDYPKSWGLMVYVPSGQYPDDSRYRYDQTCECHFLHFAKGERIAQVKFEKVPRHSSRTTSTESIQQAFKQLASNREGDFGSTGA